MVGAVGTSTQVREAKLAVMSELQSFRAEAKLKLAASERLIQVQQEELATARLEWDGLLRDTILKQSSDCRVDQTAATQLPPGGKLP